MKTNRLAIWRSSSHRTSRKIISFWIRKITNRGKL